MANGTLAVSQLEILTQSGTGIITVVPPATNTNRTLTLPDSTGTVLNDQSNIEAQVKTATNASGSAPVYACRAWVNFNGTGTVAIRASGNVSSITDNGTGDYTVNFTTALPDVNYATNVTSIDLAYGAVPYIETPENMLTTSCRFQVRTNYTATPPLSDTATLCATFFR